MQVCRTGVERLFGLHIRQPARNQAREFSDALANAECRCRPNAAAAKPSGSDSASPLPPLSAFDQWFETVRVNVLPGYGESYTLRRTMCPTNEAAQEALRLVQQHAPEARLEAFEWGGWPFKGEKPIWTVVLPGGHRLSAGLVVAHYYNNGYGPTAESRARLADEVAAVSRDSAAV